MVDPKVAEEELNILLDALCDGLRQEVRQRRLAFLTTGQNLSLVDEREAGIVLALAFQLRTVGFGVQIESYYPSDRKRRPDFKIWLPVSNKYTYLELKTIGWGKSTQYYYKGALGDIEKLSSYADLAKELTGLIALGFSKPDEKPPGLLFNDCKKRLSERITDKYPYKEVGLKRVDLTGLDPSNTAYAVIGLWVRNL